MQVTNIQLSEMYGTSLTSGMALSVVAFAAYLLTFLVLAKLDITRAERRGEGFMDTGSAFAEMRDREGAAAEENLPKARYSLISMVSVVACAILSEVLIGILVGILLNLLFFRKHYSRLNHTIAEGVTSGFGPALNAAATVGLASLVAAAPGFALVSDAFSALPPAYSGLAVVLLMTFLTASATGAISAFGPGILASMTAAGYSAAVTHRLLCMTVVTSTCPHSPGVVNSVMLAKIPYRKALPVYLKMSLIPGFFALAQRFCAFRTEYSYKRSSKMEILSLIGVCIGIAFFIFCCYKGIQMFLAAMIASLIIIVFSGMPILETLGGEWAGATGGFITDYILIFVGGCLYGQTMAAGKGSRSIAMAFANVIRRSRKNQKFIAVLFVRSCT